jgi:hypothetical protein
MANHLERTLIFKDPASFIENEVGLENVTGKFLNDFQNKYLNFDLNNDAEDIDLAPEEEIGAEIDDVINKVIEDPKPAFLTPNPTGDLFSVNFSSVVAQPNIETPDSPVKFTVQSEPENGERKVKVEIPDVEWVLNNYVDYDSFNKIKESNAELVLKAVRTLNAKIVSDKKNALAFENFVNKFNPGAEPEKMLRYELIRKEAGKDLMVRLNYVDKENKRRYEVDIYPEINKLDLHERTMK